MTDPMSEKIQAVMLFFPVFLFALCFHEFAHGWVARRRGDRTAEMLGRLTLNPLVHADMFGTVILPLAAVLTGIPLFGWAKPVPVNPRNLKHPRQDMFWIALAGPLSNLLLAVVGALILFILIRAFPGELGDSSSTASSLLHMSALFINVNVFLALFNLVPLHPLDGGKVLARFLPESINRTLEDNQHITSYVLMFLFISGAFALIAAPARFLSMTLMGLAGLNNV